MNNKLIKSLIPIVAVVVIFESVMLVSSLEKNADSSKTNETPSVVSNEMIPEEVKAFELNVLADTKEMEIGKKYEVSIKLTPNDDYTLNAIDLYVKFDPTMMTISNLVSGKELAKPDFIKVSDKKNVIATNFLFAAKDGVLFIKGEEVTVLTFNIIPKEVGGAYLEISTGDSEGDSVTMFVDKVTSKGLPFSSNKLEINIMN